MTGDDEKYIVIDTSLRFEKYRTDFEITILLELINTGFESIIAELLYKLYSDKIYMINVGLGGLIIYPYNKKEAEIIMEYLWKHM